MSLTTYAGLIAAIGDFLERDDTADLAPDWIALAEARINRELRVNRMLTRATAVVADEFSAVPTDFAGPKSARITSTTPPRLLDFLTAEQMSDRKEEQRSGQVNAYALIGQEFWYEPAPVEATTVTLIYYAKIPALSTSNTSNWLLASHPDVYLRGALIEAGLYYEDKDIASAQSALFSDALTAVKAADIRDSLAANLTPSPSSFVV